MLPAVRVQSLLTVVEDKYVADAVRHREKTREMHSERDLAGFYVYQNYLRRLRRLHKNYVKKYRTLQEQRQAALQRSQQQSQFQNDKLLQPIATNPFASCSTEASGDWPTRTNFRVPVNQSQSSSQTTLTPGRADNAEKLVLPAISNRSHESVVDDDNYDDDDYENDNDNDDGDLGSKERPIYIPCGRESSALAQEQLRRRQRRGKDKSGALSFRMWRNKHGQSQTAYST
nr:hypothetical protein BaRGS_017498 [Batillaria attramentaria]